MHQTEIFIAVSTKRQADFLTPLADNDIDKILVFNSPDLGTHDAVFITDEDKLGKGHDFATEVQIESLTTQRTFQFDANSLNLPWALAFALGSVATVEIEAGVAYSHVFKYSDPITTARQNPVTSIKERVGGFERRKLPSLAVNTLTLSGELEKRIRLELAMIGSGRVISGGVTPPSGSPFLTSYFINQMLKLEIGNFGAPASCVQTITLTAATGGTFTLTFEGETTSALAFDAAAAAVQTALRALAAIGATGVTVSGSAGGPYTVTFAGTLANKDVQLIDANGASLTGVGAAIAAAMTTAGKSDYADVADAWHNWSLSINNNLQPDLGYYPGSGFNDATNPMSGAVRGRLEYDRRSAALTLGLRVKKGSVQHEQLIAGRHLKARITATGALVPATAASNRYSFILDFPELAYKAVKVGTIGGGILLFNLDTQLFYDSSSAGPFSATVQTDVPTFLTT